jgi:hypothetical protein
MPMLLGLVLLMTGCYHSSPTPTPGVEEGRPVTEKTRTKDGWLLWSLQFYCFVDQMEWERTERGRTVVCRWFERR